MNKKRNRNYIMNKRFLIEYDESQIIIFEIKSERNLNKLFEFQENNEITSVIFNPSVDNIILLKIIKLLNPNLIILILI